MFLRSPAASACVSLTVASALAACSPAESATQLVPFQDPRSEGSSEDRRLSDDTVRFVFIDSCTTGGGIILDGQAGSEARCIAAYEKAAQSIEAADALIRTFKSIAFSPSPDIQSMRYILSGVDWSGSRPSGTTLATGRQGPFDVIIDRKQQHRTLSFNWSGPSRNIPVNVAYGLSTMGRLSLIGCYDGPRDEKGRAYRVTPTEGPAFDLVTVERSAGRGTPLSTYSATVRLDNQRQTLSTLRASDRRWRACS
ncbi:hypothetical protein [Brevundimonas sp.]|uniref:hypothetical protein n=1 Tax=Brevundimonas sp. TaxID=1871086 RepID=UPI00289CC4EF|nr:hypothetical protein [Brevundimonas sp.]